MGANPSCRRLRFARATHRPWTGSFFGTKNVPVPLPAKGDSPIFAGYAAKIGTVPVDGRFARRGVSLVEVAFSALLIGLTLVAALQAVGAVFKTRLAARQRQEGDAFGRELLAEIMQLPYSDPQGGTTFGIESGETGATRANFDDVDDYNGYTETPPKAKDGTPLPGGAGWTRQVTVTRVVRLTPEILSLTDTGLRRITVLATSPTGKQFQLKALRSKWGTLEMKPPLDSTYVTGVAGTIQVGAGSSPAAGGTPVVNHAQGP